MGAVFDNITPTGSACQAADVVAVVAHNSGQFSASNVASMQQHMVCTAWVHTQAMIQSRSLALTGRCQPGTPQCVLWCCSRTVLSTVVG